VRFNVADCYSYNVRLTCVRSVLFNAPADFRHRVIANAGLYIGDIVFLKGRTSVVSDSGIVITICNLISLYVVFPCDYDTSRDRVHAYACRCNVRCILTFIQDNFLKESVLK